MYCVFKCRKPSWEFWIPLTSQSSSASPNTADSRSHPWPEKTWENSSNGININTRAAFLCGSQEFILWFILISLAYLLLTFPSDVSWIIHRKYFWSQEINTMSGVRTGAYRSYFLQSSLRPGIFRKKWRYISGIQIFKGNIWVITCQCNKKVFASLLISLKTWANNCV